MFALIVGDLHLGKTSALGKVGIGSTLNSRVIDQSNLLDFILERAIFHHVDHIICTGDIYEEVAPPSYLIVLFMSWLKKCQVHGINVHILLGNNDILRNGNITSSSLDIISEADIDGINIYKDINTILMDQSSFTFLPFRDRKSYNSISNSEAVSLLKDSLVYELASVPTHYSKVVIGHLAIEGSIPVGDEIDDLSNELFCPLDMFDNFNFVWMGHVHKPQIMQKIPHIAHIGSIDTSNFAETDHKKHIIIFDCNLHTYITEDLPTRPLQKINITVPSHITDTTQYVIDQIKDTGIKNNAIVKVEIALSDPNLKSVSKSDIDKYLKSNGVFSVNSILETKKVNVIKKDNNTIIDNKMDVPAAINTYAKTYIKEEIRPKFMELSMEILNIFNSEGKH
jgi:exonuclease SbcD